MSTKKEKAVLSLWEGKNIRYCTLKTFTLKPDYCSSSSKLRTDLELKSFAPIAPGWVLEAAFL